VFPANIERKERYTTVIAGLIEQIRSFSTLWTVPPPAPPISTNISPQRLMTPTSRFTALSTTMITILTQITEDVLLLPTLPQPDSSALSQLYSPLLTLENLFPRARITEFMPQWGKFKIIPQLLELDMLGILALWRNGKLRLAGWDATDTIEILDRRFGRNADGVVREIRRSYTHY